jgi:hypothetical protein
VTHRDRSHARAPHHGVRRVAESHRGCGGRRTSRHMRYAAGPPDLPAGARRESPAARASRSPRAANSRSVAQGDLMPEMLKLSKSLVACLLATACGTVTGSPPDTTARVRVAHVSPGAPAVDFCLARHGTTQFTGAILAGAGRAAGLSYATVTRYLDVDAARYDVRLVAPGAASCAQPLAGLDDFTRLPSSPPARPPRSPPRARWAARATPRSRCAATPTTPTPRPARPACASSTPRRAPRRSTPAPAEAPCSRRCSARSRSAPPPRSPPRR